MCLKFPCCTECSKSQATFAATSANATAVEWMSTQAFLDAAIDQMCNLQGVS